MKPPNWIINSVTQIQGPVSQIEIVWDRWIRITVAENRIKLWSVTFHGGIVMDASLKSTFFYHLAEEYRAISRKKDKSQYLTFVLEEVLPKVEIFDMHRKSLIRRLSQAAPLGLKRSTRGRKSIYNDIDKYHLKQLWVLSGYMCGKRLKSALIDWLV